MFGLQAESHRNGTYNWVIDPFFFSWGGGKGARGGKTHLLTILCTTVGWNHNQKLRTPSTALRRGTYNFPQCFFTWLLSLVTKSEPPTNPIPDMSDPPRNAAAGWLPPSYASDGSWTEILFMYAALTRVTKKRKVEGPTSGDSDGI